MTLFIDGYLTDEESSIKLENDTIDSILESSIYVHAGQQFWKKSAIRVQRVLNEDCFSKIDLSKERCSFFNEMHKNKKWASMKMTDTLISITLPIKMNT
jgi:hypothetical protein